MTKNIELQQHDTTSLWATYNKLIQVRNAESALRRGNYLSVSNNYPAAFVFMRQTATETILVASNLSASQLTNVQISFSQGTLPSGNYILKNLLTGITQEIIVAADGSATNQNLGSLAARTTAIYKIVSHSSGLTLTEEDLFHIYPVPAKSYISIQLGQNIPGNADLFISDMSGKILKKFQISNSRSIPVDDMQPGFYIIKVISGNNSRTAKLLIEK